jgi:hypothetical protein
MKTVKTCSKCGKEKPLEEFAPRKSAFDGRRGQCKTCTNEYHQQRNKQPKQIKYKHDWYEKKYEEEKLHHRDHNGHARYRVRCARCKKISFLRKPELKAARKTIFGRYLCRKCFLARLAGKRQKYANPEERQKAKAARMRVSEISRLRIIYQALRWRVIRKYNREPDLTFDDIWQLWLKQKRMCAISGREMLIRVMPSGKLIDPLSPSIDRIDNQKGYILNNVQWLCYQVNGMKGTMTQQELLEWCKAIVAQNNGSK